MTKLLWDKAGERLYETGLDRGVLYLSDGSGVPWNGLTGVDEDFSDDGGDPVYFDGIKQLDSPLIGNFSATLSALTYPDEFLDFEGTESLGNGLYVDNQVPKTFGLSYRTLVGNDALLTDYGYKIHLLYNLTASITGDSHETLGSSVNPVEFSWSIGSVPVEIAGYRPTAHLIFDSSRMVGTLLQSIEDILYGTALVNPRLPTIQELITLATT